MSYIDDLNDAASRAQDAADTAEGASQILFDVANGDSVSTVTTGSGEVKTVAKAIADIEASFEGGLFNSTVEEVVLADGQTVVTLTEATTDSMQLYVEGAREFDFEITGTDSFELSESFPAGTRIWVVSSEIYADVTTTLVEDSKGTSRTLSGWADGQVYSYTTLSDALSDTKLNVGAYVQTAGYNDPLDGGANRYQCVASGSAEGDGGRFIDHPNSPVQLKGMFPNGIDIRQFGATKGGVVDSTSAINAALTYGKGTVVKGEGTYRCTETVYVPSGTTLQGPGSLGGWRPAPFASTVSGLFDADVGLTLLFTGDGAKIHTVDFLSDGRQCGYVRDNPDRPFTNNYDAEFALADFTNKDASGATRATLKEFSACVVCGDGDEGSWHQANLKNLRVVPSCPGDDETYGVKGYGFQEEVRPWSHWDVGVWGQSTWFSQYENVQVVGYYDIRGILLTVFGTEDGPDSPQLDGNGYSEFTLLDKCKVQGGISLRSGDYWPITAVTADTVSVEWTPSHRFETSGSLRTEDGFFSYTGLEYDGDSTLTFTGTSSTANFTPSGGGYATAIQLTSNVGFANTTLSRSEFTDFAHMSRLHTASPEFAPYQMEARAAVEMSGDPLRGIKFMNTSVFGNGEVMYHFGHARDVEFFGCYCEPKSWKLTADGASQAAGACFIAGPDADYLAANGVSVYSGNVTNYGQHFVGGLQMAPQRPTSTTNRVSGVTDAFNTRHFFDDRRAFNTNTSGGFATDEFVQSAPNGYEYTLGTWSLTGSFYQHLRTDGSATYLGDDSVILYPSGNVDLTGNLRPGVGLNPDLGASTRRFGRFYTEDINVSSTVVANSYTADGNNGVSGSFTTIDGKTITVTSGIVTGIA